MPSDALPVARWPPGAWLRALSWRALGPGRPAQNNLKDIPDPDPEVERKSFKVADGFEVNLFAADPLLAKPIQMNFDPQGRLWVASVSEVYPQIKPGQKANDKILVLEDTDGDGKADKTTVFADGLLIPTGVEPGDGGAYVANSTELLHLNDTDGDGKADRRRVVLSGFGTEDTHHILHTFRWGPDGLLYFNQSIYIHSHIETPHGVRRLNGGGIWQFRPETMRARRLRPRAGQPLGPPLRPLGPVVRHRRRRRRGDQLRLPRRRTTSPRPAPTRILHGLNPGSPKYCGLEIVSGRHLPDDWQGNLITNDFRGQPRLPLRRSATTAPATPPRADAELIKTQPPGVPADRREDGPGRRDLHRRLVQPDHPARRGRFPRPAPRPHPRPHLARHRQGPPAGRAAEARRTRRSTDLLEAPEGPRGLDPAAGQARAEGARAPTVVPALAAWVKALDPTDPDVEHHRLEALWTYQSLDVVEPELLDAAARRRPTPASARRRPGSLGHWHDRLADPLGLLAARVADEHPASGWRPSGRSAHAPEDAGGRARPAGARPAGRPVPRLRPLADGPRPRSRTGCPALQAGKFDFGGNAAPPGLRPRGGRLARRGQAAGRGAARPGKIAGRARTASWR